MRVLLVECDLAASRSLCRTLQADRHVTEVADRGEVGLELLRHYQFDLVLLSLHLPDMDGSRLIARIRTAGVFTPILALSARAQPQAKVAAFAAGADDVVDGRVDEAELLARMNAIVRRSRGHSRAQLQIGALVLDLDRGEVHANERPVHLTGKEFEILRLLMLRKNMVLTKEGILEQLYGGPDTPEPKIIDVFICKIRRKLAAAGLTDAVGTVWGRGYTVRDAGQRDRDRPSRPTLPSPGQESRVAAFA